jgi:hypothetical protein
MDLLILLVLFYSKGCARALNLNISMRVLVLDQYELSSEGSIACKRGLLLPG